MPKPEAKCVCGKPANAGIAVSVYRKDVKRHKVSLTFHACDACLEAPMSLKIGRALREALQTTYKVIAGAAS